MRRIIYFALGVILLSGCTTMGKPFEYDNAKTLRLGDLKIGDYKQVFGNPKKTSIEKNKDGEFEKAFYYSATVSIFGVKSKQMFLEFKNGILNAYHYGGNQKEGINFDSSRIKDISIAESKKSNVSNILGEPSGKGLCPTTVYPTNIKCETGGEIWTWETGKAMIYAVFDSNSIVQDIHVSQEQ